MDMVISIWSYLVSPLLVVKMQPKFLKIKVECSGSSDQVLDFVSLLN